MKTNLFAAGALAALSLTSSAAAAVIVAPVSVSVASGGTVGSFWTVDRTIDQSGLSVGYTAGVTDFDAYLAQGVTHSGALNTEWQSNQSSRSASLVFDFGREVTLYKLALWDENNTVQRTMSISTPSLGLVRSFSPAENPVIQRSEVFTFAPITTRYLTLDINGCGNDQEDHSASWCGVGEIIFADGSSVGGVPEPATWAMMIMGFGGIGATLRRRRQTLATA
ncbi:MAG: PEP-CTERM sorting domain-containing protein [Phenylobacterium sp.]|uniref:PEPxxWA-CTERM sorting domain-containing protein n=1 Tax=Phenylobacterium sp. TaxID=1871053 RepID=UPI001A24DA8E|nr:PEPxxWA-CTERM sorting domain-containing protein [Phenylobacterium sp.]MBJ7413077.1 PEP-CTERM sorting domain-containing protein [Phenylobacterium sp.]